MSVSAIRKASRKKTKLRLGISAPSGGGKTLGSLLMAYGITKDWDKIGFIDTEEGSGELYVGVEENGVIIGSFPYIRISKDFAPVHYKNAINALEKAGCEVIIIDSLTHAWAGAGGLLEKQARIADASTYKNSYTAWRTITPEHDALVSAILQSPCHIIATMRSKVEYAQTTGKDGKAKIEKLGLAPIQREGMEYEFTVFFDINSNCLATPTKDRTKLFSSVNAQELIDKKTFLISVKTGELLKNWIDTGEDELFKNNDLREAYVKSIVDGIDACETEKELEDYSDLHRGKIGEMLQSSNDYDVACAKEISKIKKVKIEQLKEDTKERL